MQIQVICTDGQTHSVTLSQGDSKISAVLPGGVSFGIPLSGVQEICGALSGGREISVALDQFKVREYLQVLFSMELEIDDLHSALNTKLGGRFPMQMLCDAAAALQASTGVSTETALCSAAVLSALVIAGRISLSSIMDCSASLASIRWRLLADVDDSTLGGLDDLTMDDLDFVEL